MEIFIGFTNLPTGQYMGQKEVWRSQRIPNRLQNAFTPNISFSTNDNFKALYSSPKKFHSVQILKIEFIYWQLRKFADYIGITARLFRNFSSAQKECKEYFPISCKKLILIPKHGKDNII